MWAFFFKNFLIFFLLELIQIGFLLFFSRVAYLRTSPLKAWLKSLVFSLLLLLLVTAEILDPRQKLLILLFWLGQIPLSFMWWSTLHWGGSITLLRVLGNNRFPMDLNEWKQKTSFAESASNLKKNRLKLLVHLKFIRVENQIPKLTTLGRLLNYYFELFYR